MVKKNVAKARPVKRAAPKTAAARNRAAPYALDLALQGGGSHGAYTWGVLDRLLEESDIEIDGISGTSAGAMNAVVLASGYVSGGVDGAKKSLESFWRDVSKVGGFRSFSPNFLGWNLDYSFSYRWFEMFSHTFSPYEWNPLNNNPLEHIVSTHVDFSAIKRAPFKLFITATHVQSGQAKVFSQNEVSLKAVMASACLPRIFQAVEINGEAYWDGGYMGNPVIWPLIYNTLAEDVLLVELTPMYREGIPKRMLEISNRLDEINFNSSLIAEMRAIMFVKNLLAHSKLEREKYKNIRMHVIEAHNRMADLDATSKYNTDWAFLQHLHHIGRETTDAWLAKNKAKIGKEDSVNIKEVFLRK